MMGRTFTAIALASTLLALPAAAHHDSHDKRDRKIVALAQELQEKAHQLYCDAVETTRHPRWAERRALRSLHAVDRQARDFAEQVDRRGVEHRRTAYELRELRLAVDRAESRLWALDGRRKIERGFARVEKLTDRLDRRVAKAHERRRDHIARHEDRRDRVRHHRDRDDDRYFIWSGPFNDWRWSFAYRY